MIEILGYLLCCYLIFKGIEIYQIHLVNQNEETRGRSRLVGVGALIASIVIAAGFTWWLGRQSEQMNRRTADSQRTLENLGR